MLSTDIAHILLICFRCMCCGETSDSLLDLVNELSLVALGSMLYDIYQYVAGSCFVFAL